jgi:hypothetical protein
MKRDHKTATPDRPTVADLEVRDYAYHLFEQRGAIPGRDLDHWLEANVPQHRPHLRLHYPRPPVPVDTVATVTLDAAAIPFQKPPPLRGCGAVGGG